MYEKLIIFHLSKLNRFVIRVGVLALLLSIRTWTFGGIEPELKNYLTGSANLTVSATVTVYDEVFLQSDGTQQVGVNPNDWNLNKSTNILTLEVNQETIVDCDYTSFSYSMTVSVEARDKTGTMLSGYPKNVTLTIDYDKALGATYRERHSDTLSGAFYTKLTIVSMSDVSYNDYVKIGARTQIERYKDINEATVPTFNSYVVHSDDSEIEFFWNAVDGAEEYELEWTYVDDYALDGTQAVVGDLNAYFNKDATGVSLKETHYSISQVYERGYIVARVRAIGLSGSDYKHRVNGAWSTSGLKTSLSDASLTMGENLVKVEDVTVGGSVDAREHEPKLTWQYAAVYAEQGKKKEVISYFDGSLRNRQSVTKINSDAMTIVGENVYDHVGRMAVSVLPVPTMENKLQFYANFNVSAKTEENYHYIDFENDSGTCANTISTMKDTSGASWYYSGENSLATNMHYEYLPSAQGYPFAITEYEADGTGRVRRQGGVGVDHQLGSGHETKYYYSKPDQAELDRLFGNATGFAENYQKEMVVDPNGQVSVSYKDLSGKVIATALAGDSAVNTSALADMTTPDSVTFNLLSAADSSQIDGILQVNQKFTVAKTSNHTFAYGLTIPRYSDTLAEGLCFDCVYDLSISLQDECGNELLPNGEALTRTLGKPLVDSFDTDCGDTLVYHFESDSLLGDSNITVSLGIGSYNLVKTLSINVNAIDYYASQFLDTADLMEEQDFIDWAYGQIDTLSCNMSCEECLSDLGDYDDFLTQERGLLIADGITPDGEDTAYILELYNSLKANCDAFCADTGKTACDAELEVLRMDVSPGGQYAGVSFNDTTGKYEYTGFLSYLSLYDSAWGLQYFGGRLDNEGVFVPYTYFDEDGKVDTLEIEGVRLPIWRLSTELFVANWKPSWANTLVTLHPEYCRYQACIDNLPSETYDKAMLNTPTYTEALSKGYLNPLNTNDSFTFVAMDTFFTTGGLGADKLTEITTRLNKYHRPDTSNGSCDTLSAWEVPLAYYICKEETCTAMETCISAGWDQTECAPFLDRMWIMFRTIYLAEKGKIKEELQTDSSCPGNLNGGTPRYYAYDSISNLTGGDDSASLDSTGQNGIIAHCSSVCEAQADQWISLLSGCNLTDSAELVLKDELIAICKGGCNADNPSGATSLVAGDTTDNGNNSFSDALEWVGATLDIEVCHGDLIFDPKPYGKNENWQKHISALRCGADTFPSCIEATEDAELSQSIAQNWLQENIADSQKCQDCIDCSDLYAAAIALKEHFGDSFADSSYQTQLLTEAYLNQYFDFDLTYSDYARFASKCIPNEGDTSTAFLYRFEALYPGVPKDAYTMFYEDLTSFDTVGWRSASRDTSYPLASRDYNVWDDSVGNPAGSVALDTCGCQLISELFLKWSKITQVDAPTFNYYMDTFMANYGVDDSIYDYTFILKACNSAFNPTEAANKFLPWTVENLSTGIPRTFMYWDSIQVANLDSIQAKIPPVLSCDSSSISITWNYPSGLDTLNSATIEDALGYPYNVGGVCTDSFGNHSLTLQFLNDIAEMGDGKRGQSGYSLYAIESRTKLLENPYYYRLFYNQDTCIGTLTGRAVYHGSTRASNGLRFQDYYSNDCDGEGGKNVVRYFQLKATSDFDILPWVTHFTDFKTNSGISTSVVGNTFYALGHYYNPYTDTMEKQWFQGIIYESTLQRRVSCDTLGTDSLRLCNRDRGVPLSPVLSSEDMCKRRLKALAEYQGKCAYREYLDSISYDFRSKYLSKCAEAQQNETFTRSFEHQEYHYTLYYYDQVGNLEKTVPPAGVSLLSQSQADQAHTFRKDGSGSAVYPSHTLETQYQYNTLNQLVWQKTPDAGQSEFWYDNLGRLVVSQNAQQNIDGYYSYTQFDALGRVTEVGQTDLFQNGIINPELEDKVGITEDTANRRITKTGATGTASGAASSLRIKGDGYVSYEIKNNYSQFVSVGLSYTNADALGSSIKYRWYTGYTTHPGYQIIHNGVIYAWFGGAYTIGDVLSVERIGDSIYYKINGITEKVFPEAAPVGDPLMVDFNIHFKDHQINNLEMGAGRNMDQELAFNSTELNSVISNSGRQQITNTYYDNDEFAVSYLDFSAQNLRKRVSSVTYQDIDTGEVKYASHYTYDITGNVTDMVREVSELAYLGHQYKLTHYDFDLVSGNVNQVTYQPEQEDQFIHRYGYDGDNRITLVETSTDAIHWDIEASYEYYLHGPMKRTELGNQQVQGMDYVYNLQGWIKGVNGTTQTASRDVGRDGDSGSIHENVARDAFGYSLTYYQGDHKAIGKEATSPSLTQSNYFIPEEDNTDLDDYGPDLWNGNIKTMVTAISKLSYQGGVKYTPMARSFHYDQLNRLMSSVSFNNYDTTNNIWKSGTQTTGLSQYQEHFSYDANGNIQTLSRWAVDTNSVATQMDDFEYHYTAGTNQLVHVDDDTSFSSRFEGDIDDQDSGNYAYDAIGNLIQDVKEEITNIEWTVYGKIRSITRTSTSTRKRMEFEYTPDGYRALKKVYDSLSHTTHYTIYSRDAQGNEMASYGLTTSGNQLGDTITSGSSDSLMWTASPIYGSSRVGMYRADKKLSTTDTTYAPDSNQFIRGRRSYELSNHLGNVLAVVSDKRSAVCSGVDQIAYYEPEVLSANDYFAFGGQMEGRTYSSGVEYKYGFNGKEQDKDGEGMGGGGSTYDYGFRIYNANLGRFLSVDPLSDAYPWYTPYQFAGNTPIWAVDLDGLEELIISNKSKNDNGLRAATAIALLTTYGQEFHNALVSQDNFNVIIASSNMAPDGLTSTYNSYEEYKRSSEYYGTTWEQYKGIDTDQVKQQFDKGKKVIVITINQNKLRKLNKSMVRFAKNRTVANEKKLEKILSEVAQDIVHEMKAHAVDKLNGKKVSVEKQHEDYEGKKAEKGDRTSPNDVIPGSKADKSKKEIDSMVEQFIEVDQKDAKIPGVDLKPQTTTKTKKDTTKKDTTKKD